jgi:hypothetical protein
VLQVLQALHELAQQVLSLLAFLVPKAQILTLEEDLRACSTSSSGSGGSSSIRSERRPDQQTRLDCYYFTAGN